MHTDTVFTESISSSFPQQLVMCGLDRITVFLRKVVYRGKYETSIHRLQRPACKDPASQLANQPHEDDESDAKNEEPSEAEEFDSQLESQQSRSSTASSSKKYKNEEVVEGKSAQKKTNPKVQKDAEPDLLSTEDSKQSRSSTASSKKCKNEEVVEGKSAQKKTNPKVQKDAEPDLSSTEEEEEEDKKKVNQKSKAKDNQKSKPKVEQGKGKGKEEKVEQKGKPKKSKPQFSYHLMFYKNGSAYGIRRTGDKQVFQICNKAWTVADLFILATKIVKRLNNGMFEEEEAHLYSYIKLNM
jgi:hypothetical protein